MEQYNLQNFKVLIVEDEIDILELLAEEISDNGATVYSSNNIVQAKKILKDTIVDFILSDYRMPNGNGAELLSFVRSNFGKDVVFVFLSAESQLSITECLSLGADAFFEKPVDIENVLKLINLYRKEKSFDVKRSDLRVPTNIEVNLTGRNNTYRLTNISNNGFFINTDTDFEVGAKLHFEVKLSGFNRPKIEGKAEVKWSNNSINNGPLGVGVEITSIDENEKLNLLNLVNKVKTSAHLPF